MNTYLVNITNLTLPILLRLLNHLSCVGPVSTSLKCNQMDAGSLASHKHHLCSTRAATHFKYEQSWSSFVIISFIVWRLPLSLHLRKGKERRMRKAATHLAITNPLTSRTFPRDRRQKCVGDGRPCLCVPSLLTTTMPIITRHACLDSSCELVLRDKSFA